MKNYKTIIIAGVIAVGLYLFFNAKKIMPMTHPPQWRDMTSAQRAAYTRRTTLTTMAEKIKAIKEAIKQKAADENTPLQKTTLTPEEQEAVLLGLEAEKEQGTGFDFIRERNPTTPAVPVEKTQDKKKTAVKKATAKKIAEKIATKIAEKVKKKKAEKADKKQEDLLDFLKNWNFFPF